MKNGAELILNVNCDGRYCSRCRFLRRWWWGYNRKARCVLFGRLKTEKGRHSGRTQAIRADRCLDAANAAWVLRQIECGKMTLVKGSDLLKSGKVLAPYIPLQVSKPLFSKKVSKRGKR